MGEGRGIYSVAMFQNSPEGHALLGSSLSQAGGLEPIAVEPASGRFRPPVRTLGATAIFAKGKNAYRARPPAPKIDKHRQGLVDFTYSLFTFHSSLKSMGRFLESNK